MTCNPPFYHGVPFKLYVGGTNLSASIEALERSELEYRSVDCSDPVERSLGSALAVERSEYSVAPGSESAVAAP